MITTVSIESNTAHLSLAHVLHRLSTIICLETSKLKSWGQNQLISYQIKLKVGKFLFPFRN